MRKIIMLVLVFLSVLSGLYAAPSQGKTQAIPTDGLILFMPFNGNANDESGNGNNGFVDGAFLVPDRKGNQQGAYSFRGYGYGDKIVVPNSQSLQLDKEMTISMWVKQDLVRGMDGWGNEADIGGMTLLCKDGDRRGFYFMEFHDVTKDKQHIHFAGTWTVGEYGNVNDSVCFLANEWKHLAVTYNLETQVAKLFYNGKVLLTQDYNHPYIFEQANDLDIYIGYNGYVGGWFPFEGEFDDIRIYNRALSEDEVKSLYFEDSPPPFVDPCPEENYIELNVTKGAKVNLDFKAVAPNTPIRVVSGNNEKKINVGTEWYKSDFSFTSSDNKIKVYGDLSGFNCANNKTKIIGVNANNCPTLTELRCNDNNISSMQIKQNGELVELICSDNNLTSLDISNNTKLTIVVSSENNIDSIKVSNNPVLHTLNINNNEISSLDISKCPSLVRLYASNNDISKIDVSKNPNLLYLFCAFNKLKHIATENFIGLKKLIINNNKISSLDLKHNTELRLLDCSHNKISLIDLSKQSKLESLNINANLLKKLDLNSNPKLKEVRCSENSIPSLNFDLNKELQYISCYGNPLSTENADLLYCSLSENTTKTSSRLFILFNEKDKQKETIRASNSYIAKNKKWDVLFFEGYTDKEIEVSTAGKYKCNSGIDESLASGISVFPNPATSKVQVQLDDSVNETLILVDLYARALLTADVVAGKANIDVSNLTAGTYFIRIGNITKKLTVK